MENKNTFEKQLEKLEKIVKDLENGDVALDDAINKWSEGMKLANSCNEILENANETITKALNKEGQLEDFNIKE
ncbi:MAG: exodeoxyribonuclease VII small subunit [Bacilli bacterium]